MSRRRKKRKIVREPDPVLGEELVVVSKTLPEFIGLPPKPDGSEQLYCEHARYMFHQRLQKRFPSLKEQSLVFIGDYRVTLANEHVAVGYGGDLVNEITTHLWVRADAKRPALAKAWAKRAAKAFREEFERADPLDISNVGWC